ncbi:uncharacterized protein LOC144737117 [Lampetra planeri]
MSTPVVASRKIRVNHGNASLRLAYAERRVDAQRSGKILRREITSSLIWTAAVAEVRRAPWDWEIHAEGWLPRISTRSRSVPTAADFYAEPECANRRGFLRGAGVCQPLRHRSQAATLQSSARPTLCDLPMAMARRSSLLCVALLVSCLVNLFWLQRNSDDTSDSSSTRSIWGEAPGSMFSIRRRLESEPYTEQLNDIERMVVKILQEMKSARNAPQAAAGLGGRDPQQEQQQEEECEGNEFVARPELPLFKEWGGQLPPRERRAACARFLAYGYNAYLSDRLPLDRDVPDNRPPGYATRSRTLARHRHHHHCHHHRHRHPHPRYHRQRHHYHHHHLQHHNQHHHRVIRVFISIIIVIVISIISITVIPIIINRPTQVCNSGVTHSSSPISSRPPSSSLASSSSSSSCSSSPLSSPPPSSSLASSSSSSSCSSSPLSSPPPSSSSLSSSSSSSPPSSSS